MVKFLWSPALGRQERIGGRQTPNTCANSLKIAGVISEEGSDFGTEANEASAQQLQRQGLLPIPHSLCCSSCPMDPEIPKHSQCRQGGHLLVSWSANTRDTSPTARTSSEIPFVAVIPILLPQPTCDHKLITHPSPMGHPPTPPVMCPDTLAQGIAQIHCFQWHPWRLG